MWCRDCCVVTIGPRVWKEFFWGVGTLDGRCQVSTAEASMPPVLGSCSSY